MSSNLVFIDWPAELKHLVDPVMMWTKERGHQSLGGRFPQLGIRGGPQRAATAPFLPNSITCSKQPGGLRSSRPKHFSLPSAVTTASRTLDQRGWQRAPPTHPGLTCDSWTKCPWFNSKGKWRQPNRVQHSILTSLWSWDWLWGLAHSASGRWFL